MVNGGFNGIVICNHEESNRVWGFMSHIRRGISNIVKRNIIRRIQGNGVGNKNVTSNSIGGGNKHIFIGGNGVKEDTSRGIIDWRENVSGGKGGSVIIIGTGIGIGSGDRTMDGDIVGRKRGAG